MADGGYGDTFDERGGRYDDAMRRWPSVRDEEFAFVLDLADPRPGELLIDIPSGGGYLAGRVPAGVEVVAVEAAEAFVQRGREHGARTVAAGLRGEGLAPGRADVVVSLAGMHHEDDHEELFAAWRGLLRPGGRLVAADVVAGSDEAAFLDGFVGEWTSTGHAGHYFGDDLGELATAAGLADVAVVEGRYHWWAADEAELAAFCTSLFGLEGVPADQVVRALDHGPGLRREVGRVGLRWGLRALVARSAG
ncbi:methyltransferase domain-containing protein [Aquihabitans daechungensis]|uniref:methyltransferase domain-containing protein n=1 Tax=Aquihabitans daechungensis TaxID=1052257 RepID=UPI003BA0C98A